MARPSLIRLLLVNAAAAAALTPTAASAAERPLIAPLDVRVTATVRSTSSIEGKWWARRVDVGGGELFGSWLGENIRLDERWRDGSPPSLRIRGKAQGGPVAFHNLPVRYVALRRGSGMLTELHDPTDPVPPTQLKCGAIGGRYAGGTDTSGRTAVMRIEDQPGRNRVIIHGPSVTFVGPECKTARQVAGEEYCDLLGRCVDDQNIVRGLGALPVDPRDPTKPPNSKRGWKLIVPRAEFAAGGTFRFRDSFIELWSIEDYTESDIAGLGSGIGRIAVDVKVRRIGR